MWTLVARAAAPAPDAEDLLRHGEVAEALAAATTEARAHPEDLGTQELYVDLLLNLGMAGRARTEAQARVDATPTADAYYLLGRAEPDPARARADYEAALRLDPDHARSHMGMGAIHLAAGDTAGARAAYERAARLDPSLGEAWLGAIRSTVLSGDLPGATTDADQALAACPSEPGVVLADAELHPDRAEPLLRAGLAKVPDDPRLHEALGRLLLGRVDGAGALAEARAALALDPSSAEGLRVELTARELVDGRLDASSAKTLESLRVADGATVEQWDALVKAAPRSALALVGRGRARPAGQPEAIEDFLAAVKLDPANVEAQAAAGMALLAAKREAEAVPLLASATDARPWDAALGVARWQALVATGQGRAALDYVTKLAKLHPFDPAVLVAQAGSLVDTGQVQEAYRVVRTGLLLVPDPRLAAAFVQIAPAAGHPEEAAALLDQVVAQTGDPKLAEAAKRLRGP